MGRTVFNQFNGKYFIKQQEILKKTNSYQLIMVKIIGNKEKYINKLKNNLVKMNKYKFLFYEKIYRVIGQF